VLVIAVLVVRSTRPSAVGAPGTRRAEDRPSAH